MTHAELLRSHADLAIKEGGMYYSGEYLSRIAMVAESLEAENAKLRELVADMWHEGMCECGSLGKCATCMYEYPTRMRELRIEGEG